MRLKISVILLCFFYSVTNAQISGIPSYKRWRLNLGIGMTQLLGDLGGSAQIGTHKVRDLDYQSTRYALVAGIEHLNASGRWGFSGNFSYLRLNGDDQFSKENSRRERNLSVQTNLYSFDFRAIYHPFHHNNFRIYSGISVFYFDPTAKYNGQLYHLRTLGTEGQFLNGNTKTYSNVSVGIPLGLQLKILSFNKGQSELWLDLGGVKSFTDYIDDVSGRYADNAAIRNQNGDVAAALADRNIGFKGNSSTGAIRGDNRHNDNFSSLVITYKTTLHFKARDEDKDGVPDYRDKCKNSSPGAKVNEDGCYVDTDEDGIPDYRDKCPETPGVRRNRGCPDDDPDGDGIIGAEDSCSHTPGPRSTHGCPDSDEDGIPDKDDECPKRKGDLKLKGCPDEDYDGIPDHMDKCPRTKGSLDNSGCPEIPKETKDSISFMAEGIYFNEASAEIKTESYQNLFNVIEILSRYENLKIIVEGHTDSVGTQNNNLVLSQKRADAVKEFLIRFGISPRRITAVGYGELKPRVDNGPKTRKRNRRVEFKLVK